MTNLGYGPNTLLPLDQFRQILGYHPFHFWGLSDTSHVPTESAANGVVYKQAWQDADAAGREEIQRAIEVAETKLADYLRYSVAPHYVESTLSWPHYYMTDAWRVGGWDANGMRIGVQLQEGFLQAVGTEQLTLLATPNVTYSDQDGDGLDDTFTLTVNTTETDVSHLAVYFKASDRLDGDAVAPDYRIQPLKISISAGVATIVGRAWLLVRPVKYINYAPDIVPLSPSTPANFVTALEVYTRLTYTEGETVDNAQAVLLWETVDSGCAGCPSTIYSPADSSLDPAAVGMAIARVGIRNAELGIVTPGNSAKNATTGIWYSTDWSLYREPDRVKIRYLAGYPLDQNGYMDQKWRMTVARLAMAELGRRISAADIANRELYHWQFDLARSAGTNDEQYAISPADLENPFGTLRGQVHAWKQVKNLRQIKGLSV